VQFEQADDADRESVNVPVERKQMERAEQKRATKKGDGQSGSEEETVVSAALLTDQKNTDDLNCSNVKIDKMIKRQCNRIALNLIHVRSLAAIVGFRSKFSMK
jgi:hypothetical protein